jgi:hypothetical protein
VEVRVIPSMYRFSFRLDGTGILEQTLTDTLVFDDGKYQTLTDASVFDDGDGYALCICIFVIQLYV